MGGRERACRKDRERKRRERGERERKGEMINLLSPS